MPKMIVLLLVCFSLSAVVTSCGGDPDTPEGIKKAAEGIDLDSYKADIDKLDATKKMAADMTFKQLESAKKSLLELVKKVEAATGDEKTKLLEQAKTSLKSLQDLETKLKDSL
jgi:conjugal transfer/entry exclusion protein